MCLFGISVKGCQKLLGGLVLSLTLKVTVGLALHSLRHSKLGGIRLRACGKEAWHCTRCVTQNLVVLGSEPVGKRRPLCLHSYRSVALFTFEKIACWSHDILGTKSCSNLSINTCFIYSIFEMSHTHWRPPPLTSEMWCWSGGRGI